MAKLSNSAPARSLRMRPDSLTNLTLQANEGECAMGVSPVIGVKKLVN
jgi:hypothetical protein